MISLIHLLIIPLIFTVLVSIISVNKAKKNQYKVIQKIRDVSTIEEKYFTIPYVLVKYFSHLIDVRRNLTSSLMSKSYWHENIEIYNKTKLYNDKKEFNKTNARLGLLAGVSVFLWLMLIWAKFIRSSLKYQNLSKRRRTEDDNLDLDNRDKDEKDKEWHLIDILLGLDAISLAFVLLTGWIMPVVFLSNWTSVDKYNDYYVVIILGLEVFLLGVFLVIDLLMFYIFFESILPLLFVLIGLYGATQKFRAGYYLFLYTLLGSLFMLLSFVKLGGDTASTLFDSYGQQNFFHLFQQAVWTILFVSFAVKTPLVPVHIWLPLAHSDANVSGSIILASIVLKLALYGFIRILIGIFFMASSRLTSFCLGYCSVSLLFSSFTTVRQFDLKVLVAYSSIAHMASSLLGTFSDTLYGLMGSIIFGLAHGFVSPGLFIIVGAILYDRCGTRIINYFKGLGNTLPFTALIFLILVFGNMGVPLTGNFIGEFLSLLGAYQQNIFIGTIGTISVITSAIYSINTYNKTTSGSMSPYILTIPDLFRKEYYTLLPLIVLTLLLGVYPSFISSDIEFGLSSNLMLIPINWPKKNYENDDNRSNSDSGNESENEEINENPENTLNSNMERLPSNESHSNQNLRTNNGINNADNDLGNPSHLNLESENRINENSNGNATDIRTEDSNPNLQEHFNYDTVLAPGTRAPHNTPTSSPVLSTAKPRESAAERAAQRLDGAKRREGPSDPYSSRNKRPHRDNDPDSGPDGSGSSGGITHFSNNGVNSNFKGNWEDIYLLENISFNGIKYFFMFIMCSRIVWKEKHFIIYSIKYNYKQITGRIKKKINHLLRTNKKNKIGIIIIPWNLENWTEMDYIISIVIMVLTAYISWKLIKLFIKLISFSYRYLIKILSTLAAYPVEMLMRVFKRISEALNVKYQFINLLLLIHKNRLNWILIILIFIMPKLYNEYLSQLPAILTMDPSIFENFNRSIHLWDQSMEYHSNIKEYQSNIIDNSKSNINLSEGNSPSSESDIIMSEGNSQSSGSAENSPAPADNAPAPVPAHVIARENELEEEATNTINNLFNSIEVEEALVEETGDLEKKLDDSVIVDDNGQVINIEESSNANIDSNSRKRNREEDSSDDENSAKRPRLTYDEFAADTDTLERKEELLSYTGDSISKDIDRLKDIRAETDRATTKKAIDDALGSLGRRAESPDSDISGNNAT
jgi:NADH-ubiquinone oxidoreductase chain 4